MRMMRMRRMRRVRRLRWMKWMRWTQRTQTRSPAHACACFAQGLLVISLCMAMSPLLHPLLPLASSSTHIHSSFSSSTECSTDHIPINQKCLSKIIIIIVPFNCSLLTLYTTYCSHFSYITVRSCERVRVNVCTYLANISNLSVISFCTHSYFSHN